MHFHRIIDWKSIVAGNTEDMANAKVSESIEGVGHDGGSHLARMANLVVIIHAIRLGGRCVRPLFGLSTRFDCNQLSHSFMPFHSGHC